MGSPKAAKVLRLTSYVPPTPSHAHKKARANSPAHANAPHLGEAAAMGNHDRRSAFKEAWPEYVAKSPVPGRIVNIVSPLPAPARPYSPQLEIGNIENWQHLHIGNIPLTPSPPQHI